MTGYSGKGTVRNVMRAHRRGDLCDGLVEGHQSRTGEYVDTAGVPVVEERCDGGIRNVVRIEEGLGRLGYQSEAAFARMLKRHTGLAPGSVRRLPDPFAT
jgi:AraC-like DNA-binding protein